jgi:hypothetical protein
MCTIMTVSRDVWSDDIEEQIWRDASRNQDGWALLLTDRLGASSLVRTMELQVALAALRTNRWQRMFLHARMATQGRSNVQNTHGWITTDVCVMHNGVLRSPEARGMPVDSMAINTWLERDGIDHALARLRGEPFANVFLIDLVGKFYVVSRSSVGYLYTDGFGNYSTNPVGDIALTVSDHSVDCHDFMVDERLGATG